MIGHPIVYNHKGTEYVAIFYGVGGWPGVGLVFDLQDPTAGLGAVGAFKQLANYTQMGGGVWRYSGATERAAQRGAPAATSRCCRALSAKALEALLHGGAVEVAQDEDEAGPPVVALRPGRQLRPAGGTGAARHG